MSPERIAPEQFGFKNSRPTIPSDCYALGMVVYETISGNIPFHKDTDLTVSLKVVGGKRPPQGAKFTKGLWEMLEQCWASGPSDRPGIEAVLQCLEAVSSLPRPSSPGIGEETDDDDDDDEDDGMEDGDDWGSIHDSSGVPNGANGTTTIGRTTTSSPGWGSPAARPLSPVPTASRPSTVETTSRPSADSLWRRIPGPDRLTLRTILSCLNCYTSNTEVRHISYPHPPPFSL